MQVANTLNNSIRILFNPRVENFKLFDFLVVKSDDSRYVAQVVEIYDDKFDASQNVAKLKLFYRITQNNEVMPYDNFTPNKECEISKIKPEEIEAFINQDKETFILGTNIKNNCSLNVQFDFFNNNAVVLADKIENANAITYNLAKKLSEKRNVVIIDTTSALEMDDAVKIKANKNFKLPLNYSTIDHVFNRCLYDASLEFQAIGSEIINEIKKFAKRQENNFIPFNLLTRVLIQQHKATPYPELRLLLARLKKYQMDEVFARTKNEKEALFKAIQKNKITIIDLSDLDSYWQKTYLDYIITSLDQEIYLTTRVNDEHFDAELINKIYAKKKNINFIPTVSYNYKKLPTIMQYCKNYVLMPSLAQRADFLDANFALANLISEGCIIFGENTDNFLYMVRDYELEVQEKRKNYRKIALTLVQQDAKQNLGEKGDYFENQKNQEMSDSARLIKELSEFEASQKSKVQEETKDDSKETFDEIENPSIINESPLQNEVEEKEDLIFDNEKEAEINKSNEDSPIHEELQEESQEKLQEKPQEEIKEEVQEAVQEEVREEKEEDISDNQQIDELDFEELEEHKEEIKEELQEEPKEEIEEESSQNFKTLLVDEPQNDQSEQSDKNESNHLEQTKENVSVDQTDEIPTLDDESSEQTQEQDMELSDDELDFFQMAQDSEEEYEETKDDSDDIDLNAIADESIDDSFKDIINSRKQANAQTIKVDETTNINSDILETKAQKENLPIFKDEEKPKSTTTYKVGDVIVHKKYGRGTVIKTTVYEDRQFVQIDFDEADVKLLDAVMSEIKLEQ